MPADIATVLGRNEVLLLLAYVPTGLGHLRVTSALHAGLPPSIRPVLMGAHHTSLQFLHRIMNGNETGKRIIDVLQNGPGEALTVALYRWYLKNQSESLFQELIKITKQQFTVPKIVVVVSTHFGLSHQLGAIKDRFQKETGINLFIAVIVTDDSPQRIWYSQHADVVFSPSQRTKEKLLETAKQDGKKKVRIEVVPYGVNPQLAVLLTDEDLINRTQQLSYQSAVRISLMMPVSGAAVGNAFNLSVIKSLHEKLKRFQFFIVSKEAPYTSEYLQQLRGNEFIHIHTARHDREVVQLYEEIYKKNVLAIEVTKPSEQAFKALISPTKRGGVILLFSEPYGRQEYDNLSFLQRHGLMPSHDDHTRLYQKMGQNEDLHISDTGKELLQNAKKWRALILPSDPIRAAEFIFWCLNRGIFSQMVQCRIPAEGAADYSPSVRDDGVEKIWNTVAKLVGERF